MYSKYTGIILKKHPLGEAGELLTIYTREAGKIRCKAVSSRKPASRLGGHLQCLNEVEFELASSATRRAALPVLISVRAVSINSYLRQNLRKFAFALVGVETLYRLTPDRQQNEAAYGGLCDFLVRLGKSSNENLEVRTFQLGLLAASGYAFPAAPVPFRLTAAVEREIDRFIDYVLEREIKSAKMLNSLI